MLLRPQDHLQSPVPALIRVRPWRFAFVISDGDVQAARRVIGANCLLWGAADNLLVPWSHDTGLDDQWSRILSLHDPDVIVDCVGMPPIEELRQREFGRKVIQWDIDQPSRMALYTTTIYSLIDVLRSRGSLPTVIAPDLPEGDPLSLIGAARWGVLEDEPFVRLRDRSGIKPMIKAADLIPVVTGSWRGRDTILLGDPPQFDEQDAQGGNLLTPIALAGHLLPRRGEGIRWPMGSPERPLTPEAFVTTIIVTGKTGDIRDLCLYWMLRQRLPSARPFPLWIPLDYLAEDSVRDAVRAARTAAPPPSFLTPDQSLHVVSCSASPEEIRAALGALTTEVTVETVDLHRYAGRRMFIGFEEESEVRFDGRVARFLPPRSEPVEQLRASEPLALDVEIPALHLPPLASLASLMYGTVERISRTGIVMRFNAPRRRQLQSLYAPTWWEIIETMFAATGFAATPSDKSRLALAVLDMLGGEIADIDVLASSKIYKLLERMSTTKARAGDLRFVESRRPDFGPGELSTALGKAHRDRIVKWLLDRRILVRGTRVSCPRCRWEQWYEFDRLSAYRFRCDGCFSEQLMPLDVASTEWRYRINELFARAFDQGVMPVLRTLLASWDPLPSPMRGQTVGFFPGIELRRFVEASDGLNHIDVDFLELFEGRLIIGECKVNAHGISEGQLRSYGALGRMLGCSRVVISSIVSPSPEDRARMESIIREYVGHVDVLTTSEQTDRTTAQRASSQWDPATGELAEEMPPGDSVAYLDHLLKYRLRGSM